MRYAFLLALVACTLTLTTVGCHSRSTRRQDSAPWGETNTIDGYAKVHGITRKEAAKRMREEMLPPPTFDPHQPPPETASATPDVERK